jgi:diguanylate cyclase (GGDEF)-like protein
VSATPARRHLDVQIQYRLVREIEDRERRLADLQRQRGPDPAVGLAVDPLTGLASPQVLEGHGAAALSRAARHGWTTAVLVVDIDEFHVVNERFGHGGGDVVLIEVGRRLSDAFRASDTVARAATVSRFAGDEFVVICEGLRQPSDTAVLVERVAAALDVPVQVDLGEIVVRASAGVAVAGPDRHDFDRLLLAAEESMRRAKGRGVAIPESFAVTSLEEDTPGEADLRRAIAENELRLHYQPKVMLADDRVAGVEALLRWQHPERGLVGPGEFIELAERTDLIVPVGAWVLREACRQTADWLRHGRPAGGFITSVNVSARQFSPELVRIVHGALTESGLAPEALCLEVTETVLINDVAAGLSILRDLSTIGVRLSIDDFGTGYSSLSYLKQLPVDELKIDQSFVAGLGTDPNDTAIVAAVIAMAQALDVAVVAEGVETTDQLDQLRTLGCEQAQGYLFARPQAPDAISAMLGEASPVRLSIVGGGAARHAAAQRVLVVDDNSEVRQLARISLAAVGFDVVDAADGHAALDIAAALQPDCVILDLMMPGLSGLEVCRRLRQQPWARSCTILVLTANDVAEDKIEAFASGADDYIVKPFAPRDLASRVHAALRRRDDTTTGPS